MNQDHSVQRPRIDHSWRRKNKEPENYSWDNETSLPTPCDDLYIFEF
jgi:hypothetical protein